MRNVAKRCGQTTANHRFQEAFGKPIWEYNSIMRAVEGLKPETKLNYYWQLAPYFLFLNEDPDIVIVNRKSDLFGGVPENEERYERKVKLYKQHLLDEKGYSGRSAQGVIGRVQGFFSNNSKRLSLDLGKMRYPKARRHRKYSPENSEVRALFGRADSTRDKFIVALMYQNGFVPVDAAALQTGDYPSEPWQYFELSRSKTGEAIRGVSTPDVCEALNAYLKIRGKEAGPLLLGREGPLNNKAVTQIISRIIQETPELKGTVGLKPTSLRDSFEDALKSAMIYSKTKKAMMGHSSDIEQEYGGYKQMVESFVAAAKKAYPLLCLSKVSVAMPVLSEDQQRIWGVLIEALSGNPEKFRRFKKFIMDL